MNTLVVEGLFSPKGKKVYFTLSPSPRSRMGTSPERGGGGGGGGVFQKLLGESMPLGL